MLKAVCLVLATLFALPAQAYTSGELFADCQAAEEVHNQKKSNDPYLSLRSSRCMAYVAGFADGYAIGDYLSGKVGIQLNAWCLPSEGDVQYRMVRAVLAHLEKQPPNVDLSTRTLVAGALAKAFPCGQ